MWYVINDRFPNEMWTIMRNGETLKVPTAPGFYRARSRAKADRDCAKLNRIDSQAMPTYIGGSYDKRA